MRDALPVLHAILLELASTGIQANPHFPDTHIHTILKYIRWSKICYHYYMNTSTLSDEIQKHFGFCTI